MATGWAGDGAVQDQIDATVKDGIERARRAAGMGFSHASQWVRLGPVGNARRKAVPGVRLCVACQEAADQEEHGAGLYNRRGSKDSQLR